MEKRDIPPLDTGAMESARKKIDALSKPLGSLGTLEELAVRLAGIRGRVGGDMGEKAVLVFAADNGVYARGITPVPKEVTAMQARAIARGIAGVNVIARQAGTKVIIYNVGIEPPMDEPNMIDRVVMHGTNDIAAGPAMTRAQCEQAMQVGFDAAAEHSGAGCLGMGEMGICNTTTSAAVACALLGQPAGDMAGRGAGITNEQYRKKMNAIIDALEVNRPRPGDPVDVISKVGGLDIAAMTGAYLGCAHYRVPAVIDGFISACAALCAVRLQPQAADYMFASHRSSEQGYGIVIKELGMSPPIDLGMRLGEGSGCPFMMVILETALKITDEMGSFADTAIDAGEFVDLRNG